MEEEAEEMKTETPIHDKPWRPADHPRPGPSWEPAEPKAEQGEPDAED